MSEPTTLVVRAAVAPLHAEARVSSPQVSQALRGAPLLVIERSGDDWQRVRGADGYEGWAHRGYLAPHLPDEWRTARLSLGCTVQTAGGRALSLPPLALVREDDRVTAGESVTEAARAHRFAADAGAAAETAARLFAGTSYQWGGLTPWGADCSGLVQTAFALHGASLPRDAWQQMDAAGLAPVDGDLASLRAGDLLFFSDRDDGRITHVGAALGPSRMVHLALGRGGYAVERLDDTSDPYVVALVRRFKGARRPTAELWASREALAR